MGLLKSQLVTLSGGSTNSPVDPNLTLDLEFSSMTALPASVTFTRTSIGTYFDTNGVLQTALANAARFDHDPVTLEPLGLLIEEARTNLQRYSQDFSQWPPTNCTKAPAAALDGTTSATEIIPNNTVNNHKLDGQTSTVDTTSTYTLSFYAKKGAANFVSLSMAGAYNYCAWNLDTGTLAGNGTPWTNPGIQACGNGWYRCYVNGIFNGTTVTTQIYAALTVAAAGQPNSAAGDGVAPWITIWGAQIELGAFPTSYTPTTTAAVVRAADNARMTGVDFSSWYDPLKGTVLIKAQALINPAYPAVWAIGKGAGLGSMLLSQGSPNGRLLGELRDDSGASQVSFFSGVTLSDRQPFLAALAYATNDAGFAVNGVSMTRDNSVIVPTGMLSMSLGNKLAAQASAGAFDTTRIAFLKYWNVAKTDAELQEITNPTKY